MEKKTAHNSTIHVSTRTERMKKHGIYLQGLRQEHCIRFAVRNSCEDKTSILNKISTGVWDQWICMLCEGKQGEGFHAAELLDNDVTKGGS